MGTIGYLGTVVPTADDTTEPHQQIRRQRLQNCAGSLANGSGAFLRAPISMVFIAAVALALGAETTAPVAVAVVTSYLIVAGVRYALSKRKAATGDPTPAEASGG